MTPAREREDDEDEESTATDRQRLDKWLWFARVAKTRTLAAHLVTAGKFRVNKVKVDKPSHALRVGDVVTAAVARRIRTLRVTALGKRRGPPAEARLLFEDLSEKPVSTPDATRATGHEAAAAGAEIHGRSLEEREKGAGRPTKRDRRQIARLKGLDR